MTAMNPLAREVIYDALFDDDGFAALPDTLAHSVGARTSVIHWLHHDRTSEMLAFSPYFSGEQMADYAVNYSGDDLWSLRAGQPGFRDRLWDATDLVPEAVYDRSRFYNDWIRGMGDDTYYCMGVVMTASRYGTGMIGIHRGKGGGRFDRGEVKMLEQRLPDLKRVLSLRGRLKTGARAAANAQAMLDALGMAALAVSRSGRLVHANSQGEALVAEGRLLTLKEGSITTAHGTGQALQAAIAQATSREGPSAAMVPMFDLAGQMTTISVAPIRGSDGVWLALLLAETGQERASCERQLQALYGLTRTEAAVAVALADGNPVSAIADMRGVSRETVKAQLKSIMQKMDCNRQMQVVAIVGRLSRLR